MSSREGAHRNGGRPEDHQDAPFLPLTLLKREQASRQKRVVPETLRDHVLRESKTRGDRRAFCHLHRRDRAAARAMVLFAKPKISRRRKERRSGWPAKDSRTNSCACRLRLEARPCSDQRMSANRRS